MHLLNLIDNLIKENDDYSGITGKLRKYSGEITAGAIGSIAGKIAGHNDPLLGHLVHGGIYSGYKINDHLSGSFDNENKSRSGSLVGALVGTGLGQLASTITKKHIHLENTLNKPITEEALTTLWNIAQTVAIGVGSIAMYKWVNGYVDNFWSSINPFKSFIINLDDVSKNEEVSQLIHKASNDPIISDESVDKIVQVTNSSVDKITQAIDSPTVINKPVLINPEPSSFIDSPFLTILAILSLIYTGKKLIDKYDNIRKTANLKSKIDSSFDRLTSLGYSELEELKRLNKDKYTEHINRCSDKTSPFGVLEINLSCPLDAYLTYCSAMLLSLIGVYITKVSRSNDVSKIDGVRGVLSIKDEFTMNQIITGIYNSFIDAIECIYSNDTNIVSKWKNILDSNVKKIVSTVKPQPKPQQIDQSTYVKRDNYVRPNRPNYPSR